MKRTLVFLGMVAALASYADRLDRPAGFKIGQRMTIRPYVSLYYTWDSNVDSSHSTSGGGNHSFNINPGATAIYKGENWSIAGGVYYQYHAYTSNSQNLNQHSWGQNLSVDWSNSHDGGPGWSLMLKESIQYVSQNDDMMNSGGRGVNRPRTQLQFAGTLQRRFTEKWHGDINGTYYDIWYDNSKNQYAPLYGWSRWTAGLQGGYVASKWTDIILSGNVQGYKQDNLDSYLADQASTSTRSNNSWGWTLHAGLGSYATERISYRATGGYSQFRYSDVDYTAGGFTYTVSAHWRMTDRWNMMLLGSSYYHPSETDYGSASRTDAFSWGLAHSMVRDKLTATLDLSYRHQTTEHVLTEDSNINDDVISARFGLNYTLNRYLSVFGNAEYQTSFSRADYVEDNAWDYDRWRLSIGLRLTY